ncbi:hypothetical protein GCM10009745_52650 [Kribbella yunnanensis]|uniref:Uncharacterized protein n=1 Tax=Kribbella yunnanensis TaxID=190194 RepID=A0ABN2I730_9ACTN
MAHAVAPDEAFSSRGSSGMTGMTRVCISATVIPADASTGTTAPVRTGEPAGTADIGSLRERK